MIHLIISAVVYVIAFVLERFALEGFYHYIPLFLFAFSWAASGDEVIKNAALGFKRGLGNALDENFLMTAASFGAFAIGEWAEAAAVMLFYNIGETIEEHAIGKSTDSITKLLALKPDTARVLSDCSPENCPFCKAGVPHDKHADWQTMPAEAIEIGSEIQVRPGERIPLDGIVKEGSAEIDQSMLTGESAPVPVCSGSEVSSGTLCLNSILHILTTKTAGNSSAARIIELVKSARDAKSRPERFITNFARVYTPVVLVLAVLIAVVPPVFFDQPLKTWLYRALIILVISCPCALVVSVPLTYFAGIGGMSRRGILVKGAIHLDTLAKTKICAFDKTGTLTEGKFSVTEILPAEGASKDTLLQTASLVEAGSNHPIAKAIVDYLKTPPPPQTWSTYREIAGLGIFAVENGVEYFAGSSRLLDEHGIKAPDAYGGTCVYVGRAGVYLGCIVLGDALKPGAKEALSSLKKLGITKNVMLTGDNASSAAETRKSLSGELDSTQAGLLPQGKLDAVEKLLSEGPVLYAGDGINDAPVLARADVGIAMGRLDGGGAADASLEAADVIIAGADIAKVPEAISRAKKTRTIVIENVSFALASKALFLGLAAFGIANMWLAIIADVGVCLLAILNASRNR
jgi:Cd2+/Zn2+-exporting ATPase